MRAVLDRLVSIDLPLAREILVVDDGSTDSTADALAAAVRDGLAVTVIRAERNGGKGSALRMGLARARGTIVAIQDADLELGRLLRARQRGRHQLAVDLGAGAERVSRGCHQAMTTRRVNRRSAIASAAVMTALVGGALSAHHSFAMYDQKKVVTLTGAIRQFVPQANHAAIHFILLAPDHKSLAKGPDGKYVE